MPVVSIRELRNHGGDVVDRAAAGESITITRDGTPVAELRSLRRVPSSLEAVLERRRLVPPVDPAALRRDLDAAVDASL